jgi:hypothetical protein
MKMKSYFAVGFVTFVLNATVTINVSSAMDISIEGATGAEFISHIGSGAPGSLDTYLAQNLHYAPIRQVYDDLVREIGGPIKNRGEAHVTVITPPEYGAMLAPYLSMKEINQIALGMDIQNADLHVICIGKGETKLGGRLEQTYYVVIESQKLLAIRQAVYDQALVRSMELGIVSPPFDAKDFHPHITLGFTRRDLHEQDGVIKDTSTCR